jgi:rod shape determining protein RodA
MRQQNSITKRLDWVAVTLFIILLLFGWLNLYAANWNPENPVFFDTGKEYFKQFIWIILSMGIILFVLVTDSKFFVEISYILFGFTVFLLLLCLLIGKEVNGAKAWFEIGAIRIQPAEFTKVAMSLSIARVMSRFGFNIKKFVHWGKLVGIIVLPSLFIFLQNDTGSALVYAAFILVFYREGMTPVILILGFLAMFVAILTLFVSTTTIFIILGSGLLVYLLAHRAWGVFYRSVIIASALGLIGFAVKKFMGLGFSYLLLVTAIAFVISVFLIIRRYVRKEKFLATGVVVLWMAMGVAFSADYFFNHVLNNYQLTRVQVLFGIKEDLLGAGYNVNQSKIAIGSGGLLGKGFLQGTQTKFNFVPEQSTDFIFCTVGEEWGFVGTSLVIIVLISLIIRLIILAERQHSVFSRVYGYSVASILFFHCAVNIGMTIGLAPVIGIPLPLFSYGGSSLWGFTLLLFIFLKLDTNRTELIR